MSFNTWEWIRLLGLISYFYFTVSIIFGLLRKMPAIHSHNNLLYQIHQSASWMGLLALVAHMLLLIIDQYEPYSIAELMIPFASDYKPALSSLGTVAFYLFFIVIITSDLWIRKMNFTIWKWLHLAVIPAWSLSLIHGMLIGTDSKNPIVFSFYSITTALVCITFLMRHISSNPKKKNSSTNVQTVKN